MLQDAIARGDAREVAVFTENLRNAIGIEAANKYVQSNLKNYITKQMATKDDPVRKLAEQGITAFPKNVDEYGDLELRTYGSAKAKENRKATGYVPEGVAKSPLAKHYETMTDESINPISAKEYQRIQALPKMQRPAGTMDAPWVNKLDPDTPIFSLSRDADFDKLGFTHMMDVLREDVAAGRLRPEKLSTITVEQAVRRAHEYDETLKANMLNARIAEQANANVFKEYPEGYRWVQLDKPGQFALESDIMGHSVRGYEPPKGHPDYTDISGDSGRETYGHGGYEAIKSGQAKVYSLRDPKGRSHVTLEVGQSDKHPIGYGMKGSEQFPKDFRYEKGSITPEQQQKIYQRAKELFNPESAKDIGQHRMDVFQQAATEVIGKPAPEITQIKGKQNAAPNEEYLPFVQDFVRSGDWADIGDLSNTGLYKVDPDELGMFIPSDPRLKNLPGRRTDDLRKAKEAGLFGDKKYVTRKEWEDILRKQIESESGPLPPAEGMARGGLAYMAKGGAAKGAKKIMSLADQVRAEMAMEKGVLPAAEREVNKAKMLDKSVAKKRLYHGTPYVDEAISEFEVRGGGDFGPGIYMTTRPKTANMYASGVSGTRNGAVYPVHAQIKNPLKVKDKYEMNDVFDSVGLGKPIHETLRDLGYDGIHVTNPNPKNLKEEYFVAFEPTQVKSAIGNRGTYDINDPDITKKKGGLM